MGATASKGDRLVAKQDMTIWRYDKEATPTDYGFKKNDEFVVLSSDDRWWKVKECKTNKSGYASAYFFANKNTTTDYGKSAWYFGDLSRKEATAMLSEPNNPEGSYLVRYSQKAKKFVLDLRIWNQDKVDYEFKHFDVKSDEHKGSNRYWFSEDEKKDSLPELIKYCSKNAQEGLPCKLTNVCIIPMPHSDSTFIAKMKIEHMESDSWIVPRNELTFDSSPKSNDILGQGNFGVVYRAIWRGNLQVAVKQLKMGDGAENEKVIKEFFEEKDLMTKLNHPFLVQLFGYCLDNTPENGLEDNLLIQEFMEKGDLKGYLKKIQRSAGSSRSKMARSLSSKSKNERDDSAFESMMEWCMQIASGMQHLETLNIIHRDLAARNILLDKYSRAKVADFGLARGEEEYIATGGQLPVKWSPPEALFNNLFSHKSDVWSYGITMWEIFTFGETPYPGIKNTEYKKKVRKGMRCEQPEYEGTSYENMTKVYGIMNACWHKEPKKRPTFATLRDDLDGFIATGEFDDHYDSHENYFEEEAYYES